MKKATTERLLQFLESADNISCECTEYRDDYIFHGKIYIPSEEVDDFQKLVLHNSKDKNAIKMNQLITEERCALLRKRKRRIESELRMLESGLPSDSIWKF